jgi:hypothetical protein
LIHTAQHYSAKAPSALGQRDRCSLAPKAAQASEVLGNATTAPRGPSADHGDQRPPHPPSVLLLTATPKGPTWIRLPWSAADRPTPLSRGTYLDETAGPGLLLAVQGYEWDVQVMRSRDVHSVGATEPNLASQLCGGASQSAVEGHETQFGEAQEQLNSLVRELRLPRSPRERCGNLRKEQRGGDHQISPGDLLLEPASADRMVDVVRNQPAHPHAGIDHGHNRRRPSRTVPTAERPRGHRAPISTASRSRSDHTAAFVCPPRARRDAGISRAMVRPR